MLSITVATPMRCGLWRRIVCCSILLNSNKANPVKNFFQRKSCPIYSYCQVQGLIQGGNMPPSKRNSWTSQLTKGIMGMQSTSIIPTSRRKAQQQEFITLLSIPWGYQGLLRVTKELMELLETWRFIQMNFVFSASFNCYFRFLSHSHFFYAHLSS